MRLLLVKNNFPPEIPIPPETDENGQTALHKSISVAGSVPLLLKLFPWLFHTKKWPCSKIDQFINTRDNNGENALFLASSQRRMDLVKNLLEYGSEVCMENSDGKSLLKTMLDGQWDSFGGCNAHINYDLIKLGDLLIPHCCSKHVLDLQQTFLMKDRYASGNHENTPIVFGRLWGGGGYGYQECLGANTFCYLYFQHNKPIPTLAELCVKFLSRKMYMVMETDITAFARAELPLSSISQKWGLDTKLMQGVPLGLKQKDKDEIKQGFT